MKPYVHQCLKVALKGKKIHVNASECPFQQERVHFLEATFFEELAENGEVALARPRGVPLPA